MDILSGYRKISAALGTYAAGEVFGTDIIIWLWDMVNRAMPSLQLGTMDQVVAQQFMTLLIFVAFWITKDDSAKIVDKEVVKQ